MILGALLLGMFAGLGTALVALFNGYSFWMALWFYSSVGVVATLVSFAMQSFFRAYFPQETTDDEP